MRQELIVVTLKLLTDFEGNLYHDLRVQVELRLKSYSPSELSNQLLYDE
jgi:hypothetical protein